MTFSMADLDNWARAERQFLDEELRYFRAGSRLISPSGDDITSRKIQELELRLEHANKVLKSAS